MADPGLLVLVSTALSGLVSAIVVITAIIEWITKGWIRRKVRRWLGLHKIHADNKSTQIFLQDFGSSHNSLVDFIADEHDLPPDDRPSKVNVTRYSQLIENGDIDPGYFTIGGKRFGRSAKDKDE